MKWLRLFACVALVLGAPVAFWLFMAAAPFLGAALLTGYSLWEILGRNARERQQERKRVLQARREADQVIQLHLVAHRLPDTPLNRARVLHGLARGSKR